MSQETRAAIKTRTPNPGALQHAYDRSIDEVNSESIRFGALVAGLIGIAQLIVDKVQHAFCSALVAVIGLSATTFGVLSLIVPISRRSPTDEETTFAEASVLRIMIKKSTQASRARKIAFFVLLSIAVVVGVAAFHDAISNIGMPHTPSVR
jgi:hypothetical protein